VVQSGPYNLLAVQQKSLTYVLSLCKSGLQEG